MSVLVIYRVSKESELIELIESYNLPYSLLILSQLDHPSTVRSSDPKVSIFEFNSQSKSGMISKLAFSFAKDRQFDQVVGIFDWKTVKLTEIDPLLTESDSESATLVSLTKPGNPSLLTRVAALLTKLPKAFIESFRCQGVFPSSVLKRIPLEDNLSVTSFDSELALQLAAGGFKVVESQRVKSTASPIDQIEKDFYLAKLALTLRLQRLGIFYDPRFDLIVDNNQYEAKFDFKSSHSLSLSRIQSDDHLLILGSGPKELVSPFKKVAASVVAIDSYVDSELRQHCNHAVQADIETIESYDDILPNVKYTKIVALDIIEHLRSPEEFLGRIRSSAATAGSQILITTPNIAFLPVRLMLMLGFFNYGKRGILDRTHTRLFTFSSLRRILRQSGYEVEEIIGVPAPVPLALGRGKLANFLLEINCLLIKVLPSFFSFQILAQAKALPTVEQLLKETKRVDVAAVG
jgi:2-polyprenyl-3-methyl-5-hydroxy-6-metoxy-1,4-benzoquinol methylase